MYQYSLNKVDMENREIVNEAAKEGKVHGSKETNKVDKYKKEDKKEEFQNKSSKHKINQKITVDAVKIKNVKVEAFKEETDENNILTGRFLDTKK